MRRRASLVIAAGLGAALMAVGCSAATASSPPVELRVGAAASLRTAAEALADAYAASHPGVAFVVSADSSAAIRAQVEQGAPIDVFLSADATNPRALADAGLVTGAPTPFAANTLALVTPADNPAGIGSPADLADPGVRIIGAGEKVPITAYAARVVEALASTPGYPADFAAAVEANTVSREDNVAAVLAKVELGEGDAGFVYATDAQGNASVAIVPIPDAANVRTAYDGVVVRSSAHAAEAAEFLAWVAGPGGQAILREQGFLAP